MKLEEMLHKKMIEKQKTLALAESMTGGALAARITAIPGASRFFVGSIVAYCNEWKEKFLHVSHSTLKEKGAVSRETVEEMARYLLKQADFAIAISGFAGPSGAEAGTIFIAVAGQGGVLETKRLQGKADDRAACIQLASDAALELIVKHV